MKVFTTYLLIPSQDDPTSYICALALDEVATAFNTCMRWLYFIETFSVPTKVYFALAALADDSRGFNAREYEPSKTKVQHYSSFVSLLLNVN